MFGKIGFIGTGNMGSALAVAIQKSDIPVEFLLSNRTREKAKQLSDKLTNARVVSNIDVVECDLIFLAVKPQFYNQVLSQIAPTLLKKQSRTVICTMAAGITCNSVNEMLGENYPIVRIMPNTPVAVGKGVVLCCYNGLADEEINDFNRLLGSAGQLYEIQENQIDAASAVSGCGPAFAYMFADALADGAVSCGLPRNMAIEYAAAMLSGSAEMLLQSHKHPDVLKDEVCSPGGSTIQGVKVLEEKAFRGAVADAVEAAYIKTLDLKRGK